MANVFDQFDQPQSASPFDQFDAPDGANVFDQFDTTPISKGSRQRVHPDQPLFRASQALRKAERRADAERMSHGFTPRPPPGEFPVPPGTRLYAQLNPPEIPSPSFGTVLQRLPGGIYRSAGAQSTQMIAGNQQANSELLAQTLWRQAEDLARNRDEYPARHRAEVDRRVDDLAFMAAELRERSKGPAAIAAEARVGAREALPADAGLLERGAQQGIASAGIALPAIYAGGPVAGAGLLGLGTYGSRYSQTRAAGVEPGAAQASALKLGALEGLTEFLPATKLVNAVGPGWKRELTSFLVREIGGENVMTTAEMVDDLANGLRADITGEDLLNAIKETTTATVFAGGVQASVGKFVNDLKARTSQPRETFDPSVQNVFDAFDSMPQQEGGAEALANIDSILRPEPNVTVPTEPTPFTRPESGENPFAGIPDQPGPVRPTEPQQQTGRALAERLADPQIRELIAGMPRVFGYPEKGGRLIRTPQYEGDPNPPVTGRTPWIPYVDWWPGRPDKLTPAQAEQAVRKALAGEPLGVRETRLMEYLVEIAEQEAASRPYVPTPGEMGTPGGQPDQNLPWDIALVARAIEIDEVAVERATIQYENDEGAFRDAIRQIIQGQSPLHGPGGAASARAQAPGSDRDPADYPYTEEPDTQAVRIPPPGGAQSDLFGGKSQTAQEIYDVEQERKRREQNAPPMDAGPGALFAGPNPQVDIEDVAGRQRNAFDQFDARQRTQEQSGVQKQAGALHVPLLQQAASLPQQPTVTVAPGTTHERAVPIPKTPVRREHVMRLVNRLFGVRILQGDPFKVRKALGFFRPLTGELRIKAHNDLEVAAHELWHWLDRHLPKLPGRKHGWLRELYHEPRFRQELKAISYDDTLLFEGLAEFGRLFLTQPEQAMRRAPTFYKAFMAAAEQHGVLGKLLQVQELMTQWYGQGALQRARSKIGKARPPIRQMLGEMTDRIWDRIFQKLFDVNQSIKVIERDLAGKVQDATVSPYKVARLVAGVRGIAKAVINFGTIQWAPNGDIVFTGKGLADIFDPVIDVLDDAMLYFAGRRAQELAGQGRENLFSRDEIAAMLSIPQSHPKGQEIRKAFEEYQAFLDRMMDFYVQSGIVSARGRAMMQRMNKAYVPFHRVPESLDAGKREPFQDQFKQLLGGTQNVRDIFENIVGGVQALTIAAVKNHFKLQLYKLVTGHKRGGKYAVQVGTEQHPTRIDPEWLLEQLRRLVPDKQVMAALEQMIRANPDFGDTIMYWSGQFAPAAPDLDMVLSEGKPVYFQIADPMLWDTLQEFNAPKQLALLLKILGVGANVLRMGITLSPDFLLPNLLRDTYNAFTMSKGNQRPLIDSLVGLVARLRNDPDFRLFMANGGGFSSMVHGDTQELRARLERYYTARGINYRTVLDTPTKLLDAWGEIASAFEYGTRVAEFKRMRARGKSAREAAYEGREISTDFGMHGTSETLKWFTVSIPFLKAGIQGLFRIGREVGSREGAPLRFTLRALSAVTLPSLLLWWLNHDDERYKALPEWIKLGHWVILPPPGWSDKVWLIPKPFDIGSLFGSVPEQMMEYAAEKDGDKIADALAYLAVNSMHLNLTPQLVKPVYDVTRNKTFTGAPIVPDRLEKVRPEEQFTPYNTETLLRVSREIGVSPAKLEHLWRGYFGTLGMYALSVTDMMLEPGIETGEKPAMRADQAFVARRFLRQQPYRGTSYEEEFFTVLEKSREAVETLRKIERDRRFADVEKFLQDTENRVLVSISGQSALGRKASSGLEQVAEHAAEINGLMNAVRLAPDLSAVEKREQLDRLQQEKNLLFYSAAEMYSRASLRRLVEQERRRVANGN